MDKTINIAKKAFGFGVLIFAILALIFKIIGNFSYDWFWITGLVCIAIGLWML